MILSGKQIKRDRARERVCDFDFCPSFFVEISLRILFLRRLFLFEGKFPLTSLYSLRMSLLLLLLWFYLRLSLPFLLFAFVLVGMNLQMQQTPLDLFLALSLSLFIFEMVV